MSQPLFGFVLMPFDKELDDIYSLGIRSAVAESGMRAERVNDQLFYRQGILERIYHQIEEADFIIGDLSKPNPNVFYEVGYAHAKNKLCVLLTNNADTIPFDLKNRRHIVYSSIQDLKNKLLTELAMVKGQTDLSFDEADPECVRQVPITVSTTAILGQSQAKSIRVRLRTTSEMQQKNVTAYLTKIEKYSADEAWVESESPDVQLTWTDTDTIVPDFSTSSTKYVNVLHVDRSDSKLKIWRASMPPSLDKFFNDVTRYRLTVSVMGKQVRIEIDWKGQWDTIKVQPAA
jgi:hypothetical protein